MTIFSNVSFKCKNLKNRFTHTTPQKKTALLQNGAGQPSFYYRPYLLPPKNQNHTTDDIGNGSSTGIKPIILFHLSFAPLALTNHGKPATSQRPKYP